MLEGSLEHNLLQEAQVLRKEGGCSLGPEEEGIGDSGSPAGKVIRWLPDRKEGVVTVEGNGKKSGPSRVGKMPPLRLRRKLAESQGLDFSPGNRRRPQHFS